jgi:hypothetical protein
MLGGTIVKKRFTDCDKWSKAWFRKLPSKNKLFWYYILDKCDSVGVWDIDLEAASFFIGETINSEILKILDKHLYFMKDDKVWIKDFIYFQYGYLEEGKGGKPHQSYIRDLKRHGLWELYLKSLKDYPYPLETLKDKDKEKDKEKDIEKDKDKDPIGNSVDLLGEEKANELEPDDAFKASEGKLNDGEFSKYIPKPEQPIIEDETDPFTDDISEEEASQIFPLRHGH